MLSLQWNSGLIVEAKPLHWCARAALYAAHQTFVIEATMVSFHHLARHNYFWRKQNE